MAGRSVTAARARGGVGEPDRNEPHARRERQAERHPAVGRHAVFVQPLAPRNVVLARRDQGPGIGTGVLAADLVALDERAVDAHLDLGAPAPRSPR